MSRAALEVLACVVIGAGVAAGLLAIVDAATR